MDDLNRIQKKLRSEKGASITFGLLLFLVCAVLSAVILVSATTASGRVAGIAATDQRYYSVTSACELLKDTLDGKSASVIEAKVGNENKVYVFDAPAYEVNDNDFKFNTESQHVGKDVTTDKKFSSIAQAAVYAYSEADWKDGTSVSLGNYTLSASGTGSEMTAEAKASMQTNVKAELYEDGSIVFDVSKPDKNGKRFSQRMLFSGTAIDKDSTSVTKDSNITVKNARTLTWSFTSVKAF